MNLRTGDIIVWRSTNHYDILSENTIMLEGFHSGMILKGERFAQLSAAGLSPSNTYMTYLVDSVFPFEEVVGQVWHRPNGSSLYVIRRVGGKEISEHFAHQVFQEYRNLEKRPFHHVAYIAVAAYFRLGGLAPGNGHENKRWNLCSHLVGYCLERFGLLDDYAITNNLLPVDYYNLKFYQKEEFERICVFDKQTHTLEWMFSGLLNKMGLLTLHPLSNPLVDQILANYDYPRDKELKAKLQKKFQNYLLENCLY